MKLARPQLLLLLAAFGALAALIAFDISSEHFRTPNMIALSLRLLPIFEKTKTVCFGRFVVDVPATATIVYGPASAPNDIIRYPGEANTIDHRIATMVAEIKSDLQKKLAHNIGRDPLYGTTMDGAVPGQKLVFGQSDGAFFQINSFMALESDLYTQWILAWPESDRGRKDAGPLVSDEVIVLKNVARNLRARADSEVPTEPGLCIDGAFIADNPAVTHERVTIGVRLKEFPDVHFSIEVNKNQGRIVESNALAPRLRQARDIARSEGLGLWYARIRTLRQGDRAIGSWKGFENLAYLPSREDMGAKHDFAFMAVGSPADPYVPMMDVEMTTGVADNTSGKVPPSLTDEEAVSLWDKLTSSIRVRPTVKGRETSDATSPGHALGELAVTGRDCPQTGWWQCADEGSVQGGRRQFFRAGERMPHVVLQGSTGLWQKLKGDTPTHRVATVWKLVDHERPIDRADATSTSAVAGAPTPDSSARMDDRS